jgi:hypothetical protein
LPQERWIAARQKRTLPVKHFHVVFTLPSELRALAAFRRRQVFDALFCAASATLIELGRSRLEALLGVTAVLHTWTRDLRFHPHVHCIVTAGGLALDRRHWQSSGSNYLFPVRVMGALLRGKMMAALRRLFADRVFNGFDDFRDPEGFDRLMQQLARVDWIVYAKKPFAGADHVFRYLGRYTHRVGIANSRLVQVTDQTVTFRTKNGNTVTISPREFLRRLSTHILPPNFVKIRHFGLHAPANVRTKLQVARSLLQQGISNRCAEPETAPSAWAELLLTLTGRDVYRCPRCGGTIVSEPLPRDSRAVPFLDSS